MTEELLVKLYLDEDMPHLLGRLMTKHGFSVVTTAQMNHNGLSDEEQLTYAASQGLALVTHNRGDYDQLAKLWYTQGRSHAGIILMVKRPMAEMVNRLTALLDTVTADEMVRSRALPLTCPSG